MISRFVLLRISVAALFLLTFGRLAHAQVGPVSTPMPGVAYTLKPDLSVPGEVKGLRCISDHPFPAPAGSEAVPIPGGDFGTDGKVPEGWQGDKGKVVVSPDAPNGKAYYEIEAVNGTGLHTPLISPTPGRAYFLSFWLKSPAEHWASVTYTSDEPLRSTSVNIPYIPGTGEKWKRVGIYFWMPAQAKTLQFHIMPRNEPAQPGHYICADDFELRTASAGEMADAYEATRSHLPAYDTTPQPGDGENLALSVAKWEGKAGIPGKPFVIWAIGSSWTEAQRDGYGLRYAIQKRFPNAPPIIYKEHDGAGTPWDFAAGWAGGFVAADQPDLVFTYTPGTPAGLDRMLTEIRKLTTADIIVPSVHLARNSAMDEKDIETGYTSWAEAREICKKHHAEFVEHRQEVAKYLAATGLKPDDLLWDHTHQNDHGRIRVWDDVMKHITDPGKFTYDPAKLERRVPVDPPAATSTEKVSLTGNWSSADGSVRSKQSGDRMRVQFTGNRIDIIGRKSPDGGSAQVLIDGVPADQAPVFYTSYIKAQPKVWPQALGGQAGDHAPHLVTVGTNAIPQSWTITMTNDTGDFRLDGSVTGADGTGNSTMPFVSKSGQISIDPTLWRNNKVTKNGQTNYGTMTGDEFTFDVYRCATGRVDFHGTGSAPMTEPLVRNLPNGPHTLEIVPNGDGAVNIDALYVYQPPEK